MASLLSGSRDNINNYTKTPNQKIKQSLIYFRVVKMENDWVPEEKRRLESAPSGDMEDLTNTNSNAGNEQGQN